MVDQIILVSASIISLIVSLYFYIPKRRAKKAYDAEYHAECDRIKDMNIDEPWYRPPIDGLAASKTWALVSLIAIVVSLCWLYAVAA